jgi:hypothetical protein
LAPKLKISFFGYQVAENTAEYVIDDDESESVAIFFMAIHFSEAPESKTSLPWYYMAEDT